MPPWHALLQHSGPVLHESPCCPVPPPAAQQLFCVVSQLLLQQSAFALQLS
jgi:hypothetical protein